MGHMNWKTRALIVLSLALVMAALWLILRQLGMPASLSAAAIAAWLGEQGAAGPLLIFALMVIAVVVGPIPTLPISAASGLAFGVAGGTLVAAGSALAGAMIAFWTARLVARDMVCHYLRDNPLITADRSQRLLFWSVLLTRLIPLFSFALISYAAGVTVISAWRFALASFIGMLPMTVVFAGLGHTFEIHPMFSGIAAAMLLLAMILVPWYLNRYHRERITRWLGDDARTPAD